MIQLEEKLYTSTEVADILGVSLRSVYRYLEEGKIDAEVKTATGRHRFSKKNILDFLYPNGAIPSTATTQTAEPLAVEKAKSEPERKRKAPVTKEETSKEEDTSMEEEITTEEKDEVAEEPIDWLAKFREAAQKYREEAEMATKTDKSDVSKKAASTREEPDTMSMADTLKMSSAPAFEEESDIVSRPKKAKEDKLNFYRSSLGGLKDIAQNIDKGSRNSYLDYAFTLNAGLSLYKPIKPFSILHAYVREGDLTFFEKLLGLTPAEESNAQLCLVLSSNDSVYKNREELHGLYVVDKKKLYEDIQKYGDSTLIAEASEVLK